MKKPVRMLQIIENETGRIFMVYDADMFHTDIREFQEEK